MNTMTLRDYQLPQVNKIIRQLTNNQTSALVSAVGTGKTLVTSVVGDELMKRGIVSKIIVAAPFNTIVKEFPQFSGNKILSGNKNNSQFMIGEISQSENIKKLVSIITGCSDAFVSTSHQAMANKTIRKAVNATDDLSDLLLIVDEAHHCFASDDEDDNEYKDSTLLGEIANMIKDRGGKILYVTATPYRTFGNKTTLIFDPIECNPAIRTIGEQMRDGYAPSMNTEYVHVKGFKLTNAGDAGIFGDLSNTKLYDPQLNILLPRVIKQWKKEKYPKTIFLIPAGNAEHTAKEVKKQLESINFPSNVAKTRGRKHPSVLIAVGQTNTVIEYNGKEMNEIEYDKAVGGRAYDIVIGCRKFDEGTDVSSASHIFMVGLPSSVRLFHQRTGRVLRDRKAITGYSEWFGDQWVGKSKVVFFAPTGRKTKDFDYKVGRQLLHCIFAAESYQEYCDSINASQNIRIAFEKKKDKCRKEETKDLIDQIMTKFGQIELNELKDYSDNEFDEMVAESLNPDMTIGDRIELIKGSDITDEEKIEKFNNIINHLPNDIKEQFDWDAMVDAIVKSTTKQAKKQHNFEVNPTSAISDVFEEVLEQFYNEKITSNVEGGVQKVFSDISGETMQEWAEKCSQFLGEDHAIKMTQEVINYYNENDTYPSVHDKDSEVKKLGRWLSGMRKAKKGKDTRIFYQSLQDLANKAGLPNMFDNVDREQEALEKCQEVINYYNENGTYPSTMDKDSEVKKLGNWLNQMRQAKKGKVKGGSTFYPSLQDLANKAGLPNMFDNIDKEQESLNNCQEVINYYQENSKYPSVHDKDSEVKKLGNWLSDMRKAKKGKNTRIFYQSLQDLANKAGLPNMFDNVDREQEALEKCQEVINYYQENSKYPSEVDKDPEIKKLGKWLSKMRQAKKGKNKGRSTFYPSCQDLANKAGLPNMFDNVDNESIALDKCQEVINYYNENGKYPSAVDKDPEIKKLGKWLSGMRKAKKGNVKGGSTFYPSLQDLANKAGLPNMFDNIDKESIALDTCQEVINYYNENSKYPSVHDKNPEIKKLGKWLNKMRQAKKGKGTSTLYPSLQDLANKAGLPNMFNENRKDDLK